MKKSKALLLSCCILLSCHLHFAHEEHLVGKYHLIAIDVMEDMNISYSLGNGSYVGGIRKTVFAVGYNENYIIAKQHPEKKDNWQPDKAVTNYYIIPMKHPIDVSPEKNFIGPLTNDEFLKKERN